MLTGAENGADASKSGSRLWLSASGTSPKQARHKHQLTEAADTGTKHTVPLYNVLWAEAKDGEFIVEYAKQTSKSAIDVERWTLDTISEPPADGKTPAAFAQDIIAKAYGPAKPQRHAYVLINPNSGPGKSVKKWETSVKPLFDAARLTYDVVLLKRGGEATELVQTVDVDKYDTVIACSGDGTPHEVFNGLAKRPDARRALAKLAVSHIPCGSGNAMACNLYGSHKAPFAALAIIKGVVTPMDLVSITQKGERIISFLSQALGIIAESDLGTEDLRWMGSARFDVGVISRLFRRRVYPCDVQMKVMVDDKPQVKGHYKRHTSEAGLPRAETLKTEVPKVEAPIAEMPPAETNGNSSHEEDHEQGQDKSDAMPELKYGTETDELPSDWETVSYDRISNFYVGNMAYMAPNLNFFSAALASDGCMDLITLDGDLWPLTALRTLMSVETDKFFDNPHVSYKKIEAYRITPRDQDDGFISIDGEKLPFGPFQAEVHRGLGRVISKNGGFEAPGPANWDKVTTAERLRA